MEFLFYACLAVIVYAYIGYPLLLAVVSTVVTKPVTKKEIFPPVSVFLWITNADKGIESEVRELMALDYPRDKTEVIIGSDGTTQEAYDLIKSLAAEVGIRYAVSFQKIGRPAMLNKMAKDARGEVFIFADAARSLGRDAVKRLVRCFADDEVGAVYAELCGAEGAGELGFNRGYEKAVMKMEGMLGSVIGTTGGAYAVRRDLFKYLPEGVILDDIYITLNALMMNKRVVIEAEVCSSGQAAGRRSRGRAAGLAGMLEIFALFSDVLNPFKKHWLALQMISHLLLRFIVPFLLPLVFVCGFLLVSRGGMYPALFYAQAAFYGLALIGALLKVARVRPDGALGPLYVPYEFCVFNAVAVAALFLYFGGSKEKYHPSLSP